MVALFLRPDADQSDGSWLNESAVNTNLFASVDEATTPSDTDYMVSSTTDGDKVRLRLSDPSGGVTAPLIVRYRCKRTGTQAANLIGRLYQGTTPGTLITTFTQLSVPDTFTTYTYTLTSAEFTSITDFTDLYVEFELSQQSSLKVDLNFAAGVYYDSGTVADATGNLSCTRASSGFATNADGTLTSFSSNILRIGVGTGLLVEDARTNVVLWCQDLTNAAWTKTNITAVLNQTGPDGVANSATLLTASAANGTVLQAITLGSSARYQSAFIKRITGTGTINMTMDNGSTWTAVTVTSGWTLVTIPTQTLANPTVGFRIVTNGDAIAVDFVQNETGAFASSPIATTSAAATRAADAVTMIGNLATTFAASTASNVIDSITNYTPAIGFGFYWSFATNVGVETLGNTAAEIFDAGATHVLNVTFGGAVTFAGGVKIGVSWDGTGRSGVGGNGTVATDAFGNMAGTSIGLGADVSNIKTYAYFRRLTAWNIRLADATLQGLTAP